MAYLIGEITKKQRLLMLNQKRSETLNEVHMKEAQINVPITFFILLHRPQLSYSFKISSGIL